jgi:hypothetical protein
MLLRATFFAMKQSPVNDVCRLKGFSHLWETASQKPLAATYVQRMFVLGDIIQYKDLK